MVPDYLWVAPESPARKAALAPLVLLEGPYRLGAWFHRRMYDWGLRSRVRLPSQVISVGNVTAGGSGKTPVTGWLAGELHARGRKVAILSRGVGGRRGRDVNVVSDGERILLAASEVGDEPVLLAASTPGVPVLAGRNRVALGYRAASLFGAEVVLLDDGLQHHRVARDLELICLDGSLGLGNGHVLPRGPLREPPGVLSRADAWLWTRVAPDFDPGAAFPELGGGARRPEFVLRIAPRRLRSLADGAERPLEALRGRRVGLLAAIARPDRLLAVLEQLGAQVASVRSFPDHHLYSRRDLEGLDAELPWVTTAKDATKIPREWLGEHTIEALEEEVDPGKSGLADWVLDRLDGGGRKGV